jgi:hypothetical protein
MMRLPDDSNRHVILGMTGSGKTVAGLWALSLRSFDRMPWIVVDYKRDAMIGNISGIQEIDWKKAPPKKPGLYVIRPFPHSGDEVDAFLWKIWEQEHTGVFIDEGFMIDRFSQPLRAILTQGRSKRIPVIALSQRPTWLCPFLLSEAEYLQCFYLHNPRDVKTVREWMPLRQDLPRDHRSVYFDVKRNQLTHLLPVPPEDQILARFERRLPKRRTWI